MRIETNIEQACPSQQSAVATHQMSLFQVFVFLQVLDLLTTIVVLKLGGFEMNPLVRYLMQVGPIGGLVIAKAIVVAIGMAAIVWYHRHRVVFLANYAYAGIVCWNLTVLAIH